MCSLSNLWQTPAERRDQWRAPVSMPAELRRLGRTPFSVHITDLSRTGCRCETLSRTHVGDKVMIALPELAPIAGTIRWANSRGLGVEWDHPMHLAVFEFIRGKYPEIIC